MTHAQPISENDRSSAPVVATAGQTVFPYDFLIKSNSDILVQKLVGGIYTTLTLGVDYTVTGVDVAAGGTVVLTVGATVGDVFSVDGKLPLERSSIFFAGQTKYVAQLNDDIIRLIMGQQERRRDNDASLKLPRGLAPAPFIAKPVAGQLPVGPWNADLDGFETPPSATDIANAQANAAAAALSAAIFGDGPVLPTLALAQAHAPAVAPTLIILAGHTTAGDLGGAPYKKVAAEPSHPGKFSITLSDGTTVVWYELATKLLCPEMRGGFADVPGAVDAGQAMLDLIAINEDVEGCTVNLNGYYGTSKNFLLQKPITILGANWGNVGASAAQPDEPYCGFEVLDGYTGSIFRGIAAADTEHIWNIVMRGFSLGGKNLATKGVHISSGYRCEFSLHIERCTEDGMLLDEGNNSNSVDMRVDTLVYQQGSNAACRSSHGLRVDSLTPTTGATQFLIGNVLTSTRIATIDSVINAAGLARFKTSAAHGFVVGDLVSVFANSVYKEARVAVAEIWGTDEFSLEGVSWVSTIVDGRCCDGFGMFVGDIDSSVFQRYQGDTLYLAKNRRLEDPVLREARKNVFVHLACHVVADAGSLNVALHMNSEPSSVTMIGDGVFHYHVIDRTSGAFYDCTNGYTCNDALYLNDRNASLDAPSSPPALGVIGVIRQNVLLFDDTTDEDAQWFFPPRHNWDTGTFTNFRVFYATDGSTSTNAKITVRVRTLDYSSGPGLSNWDEEIVDTLFPVKAVTNTTGFVDIPLTLAILEGESIVVQIERSATGDDLVGDFKFVNAVMTYEGQGPTSAGVHYYDQPPKKVTP